MDTTLISTTRAPRAVQQAGPPILESAAAMLGRLRTAIVNGPSGACWQPAGATPTALLPARDQARQLDAGLAPINR